MQILALTDIHGAYKQAEEIIRQESPAILIIGGDLTNLGSVHEAEQAIGGFQRLCPHVLCVAGNLDLPQHDVLFQRLGISLNGRGIEIAAAGFFGVSAAPVSPLHTPYEISEQEIADLARAGYSDVKRSRTKIFVPHAPPYGTKLDVVHAGFHVGSVAVREFIEEYKPDVVICGHIHEARGKDTLEGARIVNCGPANRGYYAVIDIGREITVENRKLKNPV